MRSVSLWSTLAGESTRPASALLSGDAVFNDLRLLLQTICIVLAERPTIERVGVWIATGKLPNAIVQGSTEPFASPEHLVLPSMSRLVSESGARTCVPIVQEDAVAKCHRPPAARL